MGSVYTAQSIANYNQNPPADDGSQVPANQITWAKHKTKLADPIKTLAEAIDTELQSAFGKVDGGVTSVSDDYTVLASDQGKTVVQTGASKTITTPDATVVESPFRFRVLNNHATSDLTIDGSGAQTIDGSTTIAIPAGRGVMLETDGTNWFTAGQSWLDDIKGSDIASASPLVIPDNGDYFDVTGTTGFSAMTVTNGRIFTLQFDGALTMTHGASLVLPGAANYTTAAGDVFTFKATAANTVVCIGYALASGNPIVAPDSGALIFIGTLDLSADASADFGANATPAITLDTSTYDVFEFEIMNLVPATDDVSLFCRTSANGGTSYDSGASDYRWVYMGRDFSGSEVNQSDGDSSITLNDDIGSDTGEDGYSGTVTLRGAHLTKKTTITAISTDWDSTPASNFGIYVAGGSREAQAAVNGIQFLFSSGNIESGTITVYGKKNSA